MTSPCRFRVKVGTGARTPDRRVAVCTLACALDHSTTKLKLAAILEAIRVAIDGTVHASLEYAALPLDAVDLIFVIPQQTLPAQ